MPPMASLRLHVIRGLTRRGIALEMHVPIGTVRSLRVPGSEALAT
jgi:hypothetical protein